MQNLAELRERLRHPRRVVITTHYKPDADALGSSLALANYLQKYDHEVNVITPSDYPKFLNWMAGNERVLNFEANEEKAHKLVAAADIIFCLDFSRLNRAGGLEAPVRASSAQKVLIDHHLDPEDFADFVLWDTGAAATCQLIFDLIEMLDDVDRIDKDMAEAIYAGMLTDTGSFRHPTTTARVHVIIAELIRRGVVPARVHKLIYDTYSESRLRFLGYALYDKLTVLPEYSTAYIAITHEELKRFKYVTGDTEGFVNYALSIEGIIMGAVFIDQGDLVKMSFRSVGNFPVNELARDHFEGGGHKNAAGGRSQLALRETVEKFVTLLPSYQSQLLQKI